MGGDAQLDKVTKTINEAVFDKAAFVNRPQNLARPLATIKMKKAYKIGFLLIGVVFCTVIYNSFIGDYRVLKENFLIENNYKKNQECLDSAYNAFKDFPSISLNFGSKNYIDITVIANIDNDSLMTNEGYINSSIPTIFISDSTSELSYRDTIFRIESLKVLNKEIFVKTNRRIITLDKEWQLSYEGYNKSELTKVIYELSDLDIEKIEAIKTELRKTNCFGYDRINKDIILHYRSNGLLMTDAYSYCILNNPDSIPNYIEKSFNHGKLNNGVYWFHNEILPIVSYSPWLKFRNREI